MKYLLVTSLMLFTPMAAHAACSASDFSIEDFKAGTVGSGGAMHLILKGKLVNHCATPAAAQVRVDAKSGSGAVLATKQGWPGGTTNISPGQSVDFDLGRLVRYQPDMQTYAAAITDVRTW
ncbi:hypothetical protein HDE76_003160 [Rhodanobacter sp. ANJX3]|jgi:hypothetical protein|uniref:hypothetical protein n=1 Tax=unclassified Rhodanobacter TaxID=2621553 RepID=UPI0015CE39D6|nr:MULTISPECIES: hypothetical protein [unclassified Rhodanobacter]MBB5359920.1 hypothetical protein [Rhodanobacter sp. ANJX3]NYE28840.1 hypothetical protein [Rhodanobacter sp. K2T2]